MFNPNYIRKEDNQEAVANKVNENYRKLNPFIEMVETLSKTVSKLASDVVNNFKILKRLIDLLREKPDFLRYVAVWDNFANVNPSIEMSSQAYGSNPGLIAGPTSGSYIDSFFVRDGEAQWTAYDNLRALDTLSCGGLATLNSMVSQRTITGGQQVSLSTSGTIYPDFREFTVLNIGTLTGNIRIELVGAACPPGTVQHISFRQGSTERTVTFTSVLSTTFRQNGVNASGATMAVSSVTTVNAYYTLTIKWIDTNILMITVG